MNTIAYTETRQRGNPRPRLTRDGYTARSGSPTSTEALTPLGWRRVYVWQFSNAGTAFVHVNGKPFILIDRVTP